jgi:hypothetical protein
MLRTHQFKKKLIQRYRAHSSTSQIWTHHPAGNGNKLHKGSSLKLGLFRRCQLHAGQIPFRFMSHFISENYVKSNNATFHRWAWWGGASMSDNVLKRISSQDVTILPASSSERLYNCVGAASSVFSWTPFMALTIPVTSRYSSQYCHVPWSIWSGRHLGYQTGYSLRNGWLPR